MSKRINTAEDWKKVYEAFQQVNFSAFDYTTIKESLLDYLKLYYPEDFNDYIESSDLVTVIETFAVLGEMVAYRLDMNAHENFLETALRKESVLRLATLLSYKISRNIPARGLVKMTSISTSEAVYDSRGKNLANTTIRWNDPNNPNWKEHFLLVMNKVMTQEFGSVLASDRIQVQDVLMELYSLDNNMLNNNVISYNINVSGETVPMELVSADLVEYGPIEKRPEKGMKMNVIYLNDGLGDTSSNTGFFFYTKQGKLSRKVLNYIDSVPNMTNDIDVANINETDVWLNKIDPVTDKIVDDGVNDDIRTGEWLTVDTSNGQNILFNTNPNRNKYEIETLDNDRIRLVFGDGNFANIPSGKFELWTRSSANLNTVIPTTNIQNVASSFNYYDINNREQTFSFTFSLVSPIQNAAPSESIERIKKIAPSIYYTQDRMVNGRDYNEYLLQDNSILKLKATNRTFAGDSKYISWHDPSENYEDVKIFGDDLTIYFKSYESVETVESSQLPSGTNNIANALFYNFLQPKLSSSELFLYMVLAGINERNIRKEFSEVERNNILTALVNIKNNTPDTIYLTYSTVNDMWSVTSNQVSNWVISVESKVDNSWDISINAKKIIAHSNNINFWVSNNGTKVLSEDTLGTNLDNIIILSANIDNNGNVLGENKNLNVISQEIIDVGENIGLESIKELVVLPTDIDNDSIVDDANLTYLINQSDYVYFKRESSDSEWVLQENNSTNIELWDIDQNSGAGLWKREVGRSGINFLWMHRTPRYHLVDPAPSNIIDMYVITRGYYLNLRNWLLNLTDRYPEPPSSYQLENDYGSLLQNKMISDTVIMHSGKIKIVFGSKAKPELQATFKVKRAENATMTNNQIKNTIVNTIIEFFDVSLWEFGETFYFTELSSYIHKNLTTEIDSVVLVPKFNNQVVGDLFQINVREDEIIQPNIGVENIEIVESLNPRSLKQTI